MVDIVVSSRTDPDDDIIVVLGAKSSCNKVVDIVVVLVSFVFGVVVVFVAVTVVDFFCF